MGSTDMPLHVILNKLSAVLVVCCIMPRFSLWCLYNSRLFFVKVESHIRGC